MFRSQSICILCSFTDEKEALITWKLALGHFNIGIKSWRRREWGKSVKKHVLGLGVPKVEQFHKQFNRSSSDKLCTEIIYIVLQSSVRLFKMLSQKRSVLTTPNVEKKYRNLYETLERNNFTKLTMKRDQCVCTISLNLELYFFRVPTYVELFLALFQLIVNIFSFSKMQKRATTYLKSF